MSLQIWLPLINNTNNQGLAPWTFSVSNTSYITNITGGKLGNCYNFASTASNNGIYSADNGFMSKYINNQSFSLMAWIKTSSTNNDTIIMSLSYGLRLFGGQTTSVYLYNSSRTIVCTSSVSTNDGKWHHVAATYDIKDNSVKIYVDGVNTGNAQYPAGYTYASSWTNGLFIGRDPNNSIVGDHYLFNGMMNDVRIYNNALSQAEIKEISKGLIAHYKLDKSCGTISNAFNYPTFNTSSAAGGWAHWGQSGASGSYSQNTDRKYIYGNYSPYSHAVSNGASATGNYLLYQGPAFEGGYRSVQCIVKESNGKFIDENIVYPTWNARSGGAAASQWSEVLPLGDDFYLCKVNGLMQDGSNDLVGFYVKAGYTVYFSAAWLEDNKEACSDIFAPDYVVDSSGYGNNLKPNISLISSSLDTIRYNRSMSFDSSGCLWGSNKCANVNYPLSLSYWVKETEVTASGGSGTSWNVIMHNGTNPATGAAIGLYVNSGTTFYVASGGAARDSSVSRTLNQWYHVVAVATASDTKLYLNGELIKTWTAANTIPSGGTNYIALGGRMTATSGTSSYNMIGKLSDVRIYATELSEADVKDLYNLSARIGNLNDYHAPELYENDSDNLVTGVTAGGQMTKTGMLELTSSGTNADTYFTINLSESIVVGTTYKLTCMCSGFANDTQYLRFPIGGQNNTSQVIDIKNGYNEKVFTANEWNYGANRIFMDDNGGTRTNVLKINGFSLIKLNSDSTKISIGRNGMTQGDLFVEYSNDKTQFFASNTILAKEFVEI